MQKSKAILLGAAVICVGSMTAAPASAQAYGQPTAVHVVDCDHDCLVGIAKSYMDALVHKTPGRAPLARTAKFSENDVLMPIGDDGLWGSVSGASSDAMIAADPSTGNVAWFGLVYEHGEPAYYAMRLKVERHKITEIETVVERKTGIPAPFGDTGKYTHDPAFSEILPPDQRRERERLRDVANGYYSTLERNDGDVLTLFDPECGRNENGVNTTSGSAGSAAFAQGCEAQFRLGYFHINKRLRERLYPLIDVETGVVVATGFLDHDNSFDSYMTTDGKEHKTLLKYPNSLSAIEAFKIRNGKIYRIEAIFTYVPYHMHSPWATSADQD